MPILLHERIKAIQTRAFAMSQQVRAAKRQVTTATADDPPQGTGTGSGGPTPYAQTRAGITFAAEQQRRALAIQRENAAALARRQQRDTLIRQQQEQLFQRQQLARRLAEERRIRAEERERTRQANISQLRGERQTAFGQLMKSGDQARAVMFALGYGPESDVFDVRAKQLGTTVKELKGTQELRTTTQAALSRVLDRQVTIGREGVRGLGTAVGAARAFVQGGADIQTLLQSAFGVGSLRKGERPGMSAERLGELTQQVTPVGLLR